MCSCSILLSYSSIVLSMTNIRLKLKIQYMSTTHKRLKIKIVYLVSRIVSVMLLVVVRMYLIWWTELPTQSKYKQFQASFSLSDAGIRTSPSHSMPFITVYVESEHPVGASLTALAFPWWLPWNPSPPFKYPTHATVFAWHGCFLLSLFTHSWHKELVKLAKWRESMNPKSTAQLAWLIVSGVRKTCMMRIAIDLSSIISWGIIPITSFVLSNMKLFMWTKTMGQ